MKSSDAGTVLVAFAPCSAIPGKRVSAKICEFCGRGFFREAVEKDCPSCVRRLKAAADAPVPAVESWKKVKAVAEPLFRRGMKPRMTPQQQAAWDKWLAARPSEEQLGVMARTHGHGPRMVQTPEERKRRRDEWLRGYRARKRALAKMPATTTIQ